MKRIGLFIAVTVMISGVQGVLFSAPMEVFVEEFNTGSCVQDNDTICKYSYTVSIKFAGETGTWELYEAPLGIIPTLCNEVMEAAGGDIPKIAAMLLPQESSMKIIAYENNDPENNAPPEPRFPVGPGGLGVETNATIGWILGDDIYLNAGFVGNGAYQYFACWDNDEEISAAQPQPAGCTPFFGCDEEIYIVPAAQFRSGKEFVITREFDTDDGDMWRAHIKYVITFNPGK